MIIIKNERGEYKYKDWEWNLAWLLVFLFGLITGFLIS